MAGIDPTKLRTREELGDAIQQLVDRRSTRQLETRFKHLMKFDAERGLPTTRASTSHSVIAYWYKGKRFPGHAELRLLLRSAGEKPGGSEVDEDELRRWEEAVTHIEKGDSPLEQGETTEPPEPEVPPTRMQEVRDYIIEREAREYGAMIRTCGWSSAG